MPARHIHIEHLSIRLRRGAGGLLTDARGLAAGCGEHILHAIAAAADGQTGAIRIDELKTGPIRAAGGAGALPRQVAERIAAGVTPKLGTENAR